MGIVGSIRISPPARGSPGGSGGGIHLFAQVMDQFLALYVQVNAITSPAYRPQAEFWYGAPLNPAASIRGRRLPVRDRRAVVTRAADNS